MPETPTTYNYYPALSGLIPLDLLPIDFQRFLFLIGKEELQEQI